MYKSGSQSNFIIEESIGIFIELLLFTLGSFQAVLRYIMIVAVNSLSSKAVVSTTSILKSISTTPFEALELNTATDRY